MDYRQIDPDSALLVQNHPRAHITRNVPVKATPGAPLVDIGWFWVAPPYINPVRWRRPLVVRIIPLSVRGTSLVANTTRCLGCIAPGFDPDADKGPAPDRSG